MSAVSSLRLTDFIDVAALQALQDGFSAVTGIVISFRDPNGNAITKSQMQPRFCELMMSTPAGRTACHESHTRAAKLVHLIESPCRDLCHAGLSRFVAPIVLQDQNLGTIMVGDRPEQPLPQAKLDALASAYGLDVAKLAATAKELPPWSDERIAAATDFIQQLANTIAELCHNAYQLRCRIDDLATVHEISIKLAGHTDLQDILDTATRQLVSAMNLRAAGIRLMDEDSGQLEVASVHNLSSTYLNKGPVTLEDSPIDMAALEGKTVYVPDVRKDPRTYYREEAVREGLASVLVTPLTSGGDSIGVLRAYMDHVHKFSPFDTVLMEAVASQIAAAIINARLVRDMREAARLDRQVKLAADVQRRMIPAKMPASEHYEFAAVYEPNSDLGGDFYDFIEFPNGDIGVVIADVVGKGVPASLMMASARSSLRAHAKRSDKMPEVMREVNLRLCEDTLTSEFVTAFYGILSPDGRRLRYCNAGHEPLLLMRGGERIRALNVGGLVLGLDPDAEYEWGELTLEKDDLLLLVTDGIVEAINYDDDTYGRDRLIASMQQHGSLEDKLPLDVIAKQLLWDVRRFAGLSKMEDDITLVVTRVK